MSLLSSLKHAPLDMRLPKMSAICMANFPTIKGDVFGYYRPDTSSAHQIMRLETFLSKSDQSSIPVEIEIATKPNTEHISIAKDPNLYMIDKPIAVWQPTTLFGQNGEYFVGQKQPVVKVYADGSMAHSGTVARKWRYISNHDYETNTPACHSLTQD